MVRLCVKIKGNMGIPPKSKQNTRYSNCDPGISSVAFIWELLKNAECQAPVQTH